MPQVNKQALSQFIRSKCQRQLALNLYPDTAAFQAERAQYGMPYVQSPRPGLQHIRQAGEDWQAEKLHDLTSTFGAKTVVGQPRIAPNGETRYDAINLINVIRNTLPGQFLVECQFDVRDGGTFQTALQVAGHRAQFNLGFAEARPDIIEVAAAGTFDSFVAPDGSLCDIPAGDTRTQLRIIDIKLTARPSQGYFAEVAYYSMTLAGWLIDEGLAGDFVVTGNAAVWPGSHDASNLVRVKREIEDQHLTPTFDQLRAAMQEDLEEVPFDVFVLFIRRFLQTEVPQVLTIVQQASWQNLEWHVDNRCSFCDYLGENRPPSANDPHVVAHPKHCLPMAQGQDHLSRVPFVSRGARQSLLQDGVVQVADLAQRQPADTCFDSHQTLRATRTVVSSRAQSLQNQQTSLAQQSGTSASMPRWADLKIYLTVDFDVGSAITVAFGLKAFWYEPRSQNSPLTGDRNYQAWKAHARVIDQRDINTEQRELLVFLREIHDILEQVRQIDNQTASNPAVSGLNQWQRAQHRTTVQFYLWDDLQFQHLTRVIGRHLDAIMQQGDISYLTWLFPPEELLPNPDLSTRLSPITVVRDAVRGHLAAPIPHYYSLLEVARQYHEQTLPAAVAAFSVHPLFSVPLSDQIPSERAHEIWTRVGRPPWQDQMRIYSETVQKRLSALETVTKRLGMDLGNQLGQAAPPLANLGGPTRISRACFDGQLWYAHAKLNAALDELDVQQVRAMPAHERAARFRSARLVRRLTGADEQNALTTLGLPPIVGRRAYELHSDSLDVKFKVGEFQCSLAPENLAGFLDDRLMRVVRGTVLEGPYSAGNGNWRTAMAEVTKVTVSGLDRNQLLIAVDFNQRHRTTVDDLIRHNLLDLERDVILDPTQNDYFTGKLSAALQAIGNPPLAASAPHVARVRSAIGQTRGRGANRTAHTPVADFLWDCQTMATTPVARNLAPVRNLLATNTTRPLTLNPTQWQAWEDALSFRARLIWGPPGTGKSRTVRAIVDGAVLTAQQASRPLRVLVTASTYTAIDNVLIDIGKDLAAMAPGACSTYRVRSGLREAPTNLGATVDVELNRHSPSATVLDICNHLENNDTLIVVGTTSEQTHNLFTVNNGDAQREWFDLIVIDEASQIDVAHTILPLCGIADGGAVVLAGDPKQLPPIHQAEAPAGLEDLVGSAYAFFQRLHSVPFSALDINYRSNDEIVDFARQSGYRQSLQSHSTGLRIDMLQPAPAAQPADWPAGLFWTSEWSRFLDPDQPAVTFIYDDGRNSQRNPFEAEAVTALLTLLSGRMGNQLLNENHPVTGSPSASAGTPYTQEEFWQKAVGVVTPHRAQQGLIVSRLIEVFGATGALADAIRDAVDTVERFQGQQRDVMIASFALGDPDQIQDEDEFLMSLNRFNVMASRARAKLIVLVSRQVVDHLANEVDVLRDSRLLKVFAESFCSQSSASTLGFHNSNGNQQQVPGLFRWHS